MSTPRISRWLLLVSCLYRQQKRGLLPCIKDDLLLTRQAFQRQVNYAGQSFALEINIEVRRRVFRSPRIVVGKRIGVSRRMDGFGGLHGYFI